jgi:hypothetical protein
VRHTYVPIKEPRLLLDAVDGLSQNLAKVRTFLGVANAA